jgi:chaperonin GroEL
VYEVNRLVEQTQQLLHQLSSSRELHKGAEAVLWPFHPSYRADVGQEPTTEQKVLIGWRKQLVARNDALRAYYIRGAREQSLQLYPLSGFGSQINFGYSFSAEQCISILAREVELLRMEQDQKLNQSEDLGRRANSPSPNSLSNSVPRVFVSSTIDDLEEFRDAARQAAIEAECFPVMSESFPASGAAPPLATCLEKVSECDALVVIVGHRYGWIPDELRNNLQRSITWLECLEAQRHAKEIIAFLVDESAVWPEERREEWAITNAIRQATASEALLLDVQQRVAKLRDFKQWLSNERYRKTFRSVDDLHREIVRALVGWKGRHSKFEKTSSGLIYRPESVVQDSSTLVARGISLAASAVAASFGPRGSLVTATDEHGRMRLIKRGRDIVAAVHSTDPIEKVGIKVMHSLSEHVTHSAGDGGKTSILVASSLINECLPTINAGMPPLDLAAGLERAGRVVASALELQAKPATNEILLQLSRTAAHGDELSESVGVAIRDAGPDGIVVVERIVGTSAVRLERDHGYVIEAGYASPAFAIDGGTNACHLRDVLVLVSDLRLTSLSPLLGLLEAVARTNKPFLVIASFFDDEVLQTLLVNARRRTLPCVAIRVPGDGMTRQNRLADIAALTGARIVTEALGHTIKEVTVRDLGSATEVFVNETQTSIFLPEQDPPILSEYLEHLRSTIAATKNDYDREKLQERLAKLVRRVLHVKVGGIVASELDERIYKAESSMHSVRSAGEQGYVLGGGLALLLAKEALSQMVPRDEAEKLAVTALTTAIEVPARLLACSFDRSFEDYTALLLTSSNALPDTGIGNAVAGLERPLDSVSTVRTALLSAVSTSRSILQTRTWKVSESTMAAEDLAKRFDD